LNSYLNAKDQEAVIATTIAPTAPTTLSPAELLLANEYIYSEERNDKIGLAADSFAKQIIELAESGKIGRFDFHKGNSKLGYLQHDPYYGGSDTQVAVELEQNEDGSFDLNTVANVSIVNSNGAIVIRASEDNVWSVAVIPANRETKELDLGNMRESGEIYPYHGTLAIEELKRVEDDAIDSFTRELKSLSDQK
jgi:hypothetical protein